MIAQTSVEKIISRHVGKTVSRGEIVIVDVDGVLASDTTAPLAIKAFHEMGGERPWNSEKIFFVIDHASPAPNERIAGLHQLMREFAKEHGVKLYDVGDGICHQLMVENNHVKPGDLFVGADSHTCTYGSLGVFSVGVGSTDMAAVMLTGKTWLKVPGTIKIEVNGQLQSMVSAKDLILHIVSLVGIAGATYQAIEFHGETLTNMSLDSRMTVANMAVEMGAKACIINPAGLTRWDAAEFEDYLPDEKAVYSSILKIDASTLKPQISLPHLPDNVESVGKVKGVAIDCGFIGSCVNGRLEDLEVAAEILRGNKIAEGVRLLVSPASRSVFLEAVKTGAVETLISAGATFIPVGCGPCVGTHNGVPGNGEVVVSTANRNFKGRMGNPNTSIYLASPAVVAASTIEGKITDPNVLLSS